MLCYKSHLINAISYSSLFARVKAAITDGLVLLLFMIIAVQLFSSFDNVPDSAKLIAVLFIFFLYDPIFTSSLGGTIGHRLNGIRVKQEADPERNIPFHMALLRFFAKSLLGWISLFSVTGNPKRQAIHDFIIGSVVIYKSTRIIQHNPVNFT